MWRRVFSIGGGGHLEPLCVEHAGLMARLLDDAEVAHLEPALRAQAPAGRWVPLADLANWGLPAPLRRLLVG